MTRTKITLLLFIVVTLAMLGLSGCGSNRVQDQSQRIRDYGSQAD